MDNQATVDLMTFYSEIASFVSKNCYVTQSTPLSRSVELLIDPAIESEGLTADFASKRQVFESLKERTELRKLRIASNPGSHHSQALDLKCHARCKTALREGLRR